MAFASIDAGNQWRVFNKLVDKIAAEQVSTAMGVIALDAFIGNNDRSPHNPNLLVRGLDWRLIDHESAFMLAIKLFPPVAPWRLGNLSMLRAAGTDGEHVFAAHLARQKDLDWGHIRSKWAGLSDTRLAQYATAIPTEWASVRPQVAAAIGHIRLVRDKIDDCLAELKRTLT